MLSALGGAMFTLQVGFMSPSLVGIVPSIEMVIYTAVGGRMSLVGAVFGSLVVNYGKTVFSENFPQLWLFLIAALFLSVVMFFPNGLAGIYAEHGTRIKGWFKRIFARRPVAPALEQQPAPRAPVRLPAKHDERPAADSRDQAASPARA
jgi:urea transport system permease protein